MHFAYDQSLSSSHEPDRETKDEETEVVGDWYSVFSLFVRQQRSPL